MIIRYPTGLYKSVLPSTPTSGVSVTFTISNTAPPRTALLFPKLPPGIAARRREAPAVGKLEQRSYVDTLVYTTNRASRVAAGTATKQYEVGDVLGFDDFQQLPTSELLTAGLSGEKQHDTGLLDYESIGLGSDTQMVLSKAESAFAQKSQRLALLRESYQSLQVAINEAQKKINEISKAIAAIEAIGDDSLAGTLEKLRLDKAGLLRSRGTDINSANAVAAEADAVNADLLAISNMVR